MDEEFKAEWLSLADEFAVKGTVKHFAMRLGFMPHNEEDAEKLLESIIIEHENMENELRYGE